MSLKILSINVNGLQNEVKRRAIFNYIRDRADIACLQETHSTTEAESLWNLQWKGRILYSHGNSNARGVAILIKHSCQAEAKIIEHDSVGRRITVEIIQDQKSFSLCNLYAPNIDDPGFFVETFDKVFQKGDKPIFIGDFNTVLDMNLDRRGSKYNNYKSSEIIKKVCADMLLVDVWRNRNQGVKRYTYLKKAPFSTASHIDYALAPTGVDTDISSCFYIPCTMTDHTAMFVNIKISENQRGPGYWKFNDSLLENKDFIEKMRNTLIETCREHASQSDIDKWEMIKFKAANFSQNWSNQTAQEKRLIISQLYEKLAEMEEQLSQKYDDKTYDIMSRTKQDLDAFETERAKGILFRCRAKWQVEAERNTAYFYSLEKAKYNSKTCSTLIDSKGKIIRDQRSILKIQGDFYRNLYKKDQDIKFVNPGVVCESISEADKARLDQPFSLEEFEVALRQMPNGRTPGADGLSVKFYKTFYNELKQPLYNCLMSGLKRQKLHNSARRGIISLIPKANKDTRILKCLRPIALLNIDLKILEKATANRIMTVIDGIIHHNQKGFMRNRRISANIRKVLEIIKHAHTNNENVAVVSVDFLKCFDKISMDAITGCLKIFGFEDNFIQMITTTYKDFSACVQNNGYFSDPFPIEKGVQQGAPNSSFIFLLCAELMATMLRQNKKIHGIPINDIMYLLGQYADDMDVYIKAKKSSFQELFKTLDEFQNISGFCINYDKTSVYRAGGLKTSAAKCYTERTLHWTNNPINILGIQVCDDQNLLMTLNYNPIIEKSKAILSLWSKRALSLIGRVMIVNSLVSSLFVYKMLALRKIPEYVIGKYDKMISDFLWDGRRPKIAMKHLKSSKTSGGLKLSDLRKKDQALKVSWVQILQNDAELANLAYLSLNNDIKEKIWSCSLASSDITSMFESSFWRDVLEAWSLCNKNKQRPPSEQILWYNSSIRIDDRPIIWKKCALAGLWSVSQLYPNGKLIGIRDAHERYDINIMQLNGIISALPRHWREHCRQSENQSNLTETPIEIISASAAYETLVQDDHILNEKLEKWQKDIGINIPYKEFAKGFVDINITTNITKLRSFQYRLLHRSLVTNIKLHKWKIINSELCSFCQREPETLLHMLIYCKHVQELWIKMEQFMLEFSNDPINFNVDTVIWNRIIHTPIGHVKNLICLVTKQFIYKQRCLKKKLNWQECAQYVRTIERNEKYYAVKNDNLFKHERKWRPNNKNNIDSSNIDGYIAEYLIKI